MSRGTTPDQGPLIMQIRFYISSLRGGMEGLNGYRQDPSSRSLRIFWKASVISLVFPSAIS